MDDAGGDNPYILECTVQVAGKFVDYESAEFVRANLEKDLRDCALMDVALKITDLRSIVAEIETAGQGDESVAAD